MRHLFMMMIAISSFGFSVPAAQSAEQLSQSDMKTAIEMNKIYAHHMYASSCMERQRQIAVPETMTPQDKAAMMASYQKSCDCLTNGVMEKFSPNDVIGFVTQMNGSVAPGKEDVMPDQQTIQKNAQMMVYAGDKKVRSECGFKE